MDGPFVHCNLQGRVRIRPLLMAERQKLSFLFPSPLQHVFREVVTTESFVAIGERLFLPRFGAKKPSNERNDISHAMTLFLFPFSPRPVSVMLGG